MSYGVVNWLWSSEPEWNLDWVTKCERESGTHHAQYDDDEPDILTERAYLGSTKGDGSGEGNVWLEWVSYSDFTDEDWEGMFGDGWRSLATPVRSRTLSLPTVFWNLELSEYPEQEGYKIEVPESGDWSDMGWEWIDEWSYNRFLGNSTQSGLKDVELDDKQVVPFAVLQETFQTKAVSLSDSFNLAVMRKVKEIAPTQLCEFFMPIFYYQEKRLGSEHGHEKWFSISGGTPIERLMIKLYSRQELSEICGFPYTDKEWAILNNPPPKTQSIK